jgi:hypothetical protein
VGRLSRLRQSTLPSFSSRQSGAILRRHLDGGTWGPLSCASLGIVDGVNKLNDLMWLSQQSIGNLR